MNGWVLPDELLRDAPAHTPQPRELADLELLVTGALAPLPGFHTRADLHSISRQGRLADGTSWPVPITLEIPTSLVEALDSTNPLKRVVVLTDGEGAPVAAIDAVDIWPTREGFCGVGGPVRGLGDDGHGPFRPLRRRPEEIRDLLPAGRVLGVIADRPLHRPHLAQMAYACRTIAGHALVLIPVSAPGPDGLPPEALVRSVLAGRDRMPPATIVAVPLHPRGNEIADALLRAKVAANYGASHLLAVGPVISGGGPRALLPRELAYDGRDGQWRGADDIPPRHRRTALPREEIESLLDRGLGLPEWHTPPAVTRELVRARPPRRSRGLVVFFTGLSGSGKSTIARGVADALAETGERTVTVLDGDVARRWLSKGLTFSREDRDVNIRRIGFVAAEVGRHGGLTLCCPIAPFQEARSAARALARQAGAGFVLVYVSTPLAVCEERDRKGLYAKARAGTLTGMTGVDDPYEVPPDPDVTIDTTDISVDDGIDIVLDYLAEEGWLDAR